MHKITDNKKRRDIKTTQQEIRKGIKTFTHDINMDNLSIDDN